MANAINNLGQVVGNAVVPNSNFWKAFEFDGNSFSLLPLSPDNWDNEALAINDRGQIAGYNSQNGGFLYYQGAATTIPTLGGESSVPVGINDTGDVVGRSHLASRRYAPFLYSRGTLTNLGAQRDSSGDTANAINSNGQIVGGSPPGTGGFHAALY